MNHLFITDPIQSLDPKSDTTLLLISEAKRRGHTVTVAEIKDICVINGKVLIKETPIENFDVVWLRKDPPVDRAYFEHLQILALASDKTFFVNDPVSILKFGDKIGPVLLAHLMPETIIAKDPSILNRFISSQSKSVTKPLNAFSGRGVDVNGSSDIIQEQDFFLMAQPYLPAIEQGDVRIHIAGGEILGAISRVPKQGSHLSNLHAGGTAQRIELSPALINLATEVGEFLLENRIFFAGIDIIDGKLNEINITSPGILIETNLLANENLEIKLFDILEEHV
jgi:glutathione synthase